MVAGKSYQKAGGFVQLELTGWPAASSRSASSDTGQDQAHTLNSASMELCLPMRPHPNDSTASKHHQQLGAKCWSTRAHGRHFHSSWDRTIDKIISNMCWNNLSPFGNNFHPNSKLDSQDWVVLWPHFFLTEVFGWTLQNCPFNAQGRFAASCSPVFPSAPKQQYPTPSLCYCRKNYLNFSHFKNNNKTQNKTFFYPLQVQRAWLGTVLISAG